MPAGRGRSLSMKGRWLGRAGGALALLIGLSLSGTADAQFNPGGRTRSKPGAGKPHRAKPQRKKPQAKPTRKQDPDRLIKRYRDIVLKQPGAQFPLQRLAQLYRERDGKLDKLIEELESLAKGSGKKAYNAKVALAGIYRQDGQMDRAVSTYEDAIKERPKDHIALVALAHLLQDRGDKAGAYTRFEKALPRLKIDADIEQTLRTLMGLALDLEHYKEASEYHDKLVKRAKGSFFVRAELGRELMLRSKYERAVKEFEDVVKHASGDNRVLAPALRDLGRAQAKAKQTKDALKTLKRALRVAGAEAGVRREIYDVIVEVYRAEDKLRELITMVEQEKSRDFYRAKMLGALYEETGQVKKALKAYQEALAKKSSDIETRLKVVQLLQIQGELEEAIKQYEALIRAAPRNPDFVFQLAEALIQRGDRKGALEHLKKLEDRSKGDEETLAALVDFYERVEERKRAMAVLQRLARDPRDPRHLVDLGDRYYQDGDKEKAVRTWKRIMSLIPNRARALYTLGEVYLEHDMPKEALESLAEAVKLAPKLTNYKKAYALALERTGAGASSAQKRAQYDQALKIWEALLLDASAAHVAREARQHIVTLWSLSGQLEDKVSPLSRRLNSKPPDLDAGRLLAEIHVRRKRYSEAEKVLKKVTDAAPGDAESFLRLEHVLVVQRKLKAAIAVLEKLVKVEPKRAREYYQRMANYAAELYQDDAAIKYAARAVELSPDDAEGHRKLGEMYRRRQDNDKAIAQFRQAIAKNDRLFLVYFQLAELLINRGEIDEADQLLRRVVRASPDEDLVSQATRISMQLNLGRGTLESLEKELLPVALGNPGKPIYRRLLVEIYGAMAFPLVHLSKSTNPTEAKKASAELAKIGERAVKPLLDALSDDQGTQQRTALELLSHIKNKGAGPSLVAYATGKADADLRVWAMLAVASLQDPGLLPKLSDLIAPGNQVRSEEADPVLVAAAYAVARMQDPRARPLLLKLLESDAPSVRACGALGLGLVGTAQDTGRLAEIARSLEAGPLPRAAAAFALGERGASQQVDVLAQLAEANDPLVRGQAILALARLKDARAGRAITAAWLSADDRQREAARAAAVVLATGKFSVGSALERPPRSGKVDVRELVASLTPEPPNPDAAADAIIKLAPALAESVGGAVQSSPERAEIVAEMLPASGAKLQAGALGFNQDFGKLAPAKLEQLRSAIERIAHGAVDSFISLSNHPTADVRSHAVQFLATRPEVAARSAVVARLTDHDESVQLTALTAIGDSGKADSSVTSPIAKLLGTKKLWTLRARAAETLGQLGSAARSDQMLEALSEGAERDEMAIVREACFKALLEIDAGRAKQIAAYLAEHDSEPRLRAVAKQAL
ncbi:MAG: HEAT repeat domain-containing protein [Myxococcales bacterium]|nr:HEAT repeat domain-containing protein [Myxococcales bacterium]